MPGPTQDLINRCYAVLARCDQFSSMHSLQAVFVSEELYPFRDRLRDAHSLDERVRQNVDYLLYKTTTGGRYIFTLFLQALCPSSEIDALHGDLDSLRSEFEQSLGQVKRINVPYVVAAMTRTEADALKSGAVFQDPRIAPFEQGRFEAVKPFLPEHWITDYGERRDDWKLHADQSSMIGKVLDEMFAHINLCLRQPQNLPVIDPIPFSDEFFSSEKQGETWEYLRQSGGILIMDAVSLFYPPIRQALLQSALISGEQMAVLVLSPMDFYAVPVNDRVKNLIAEEMPMTFARFAKHLDYRYEMGVGDLWGVQRWLFTLFSNPMDMAESVQRRKVDLNRVRFRNKVNPQTNGNMGQHVSRQGEVEK